MFFQWINIRQVSWEVLKTAAFGLGFQHLPRHLANVNAWKTMFDPYSSKSNLEGSQGKKRFYLHQYRSKMPRINDKKLQLKYPFGSVRNIATGEGGS